MSHTRIWHQRRLALTSVPIAVAAAINRNIWEVRPNFGVPNQSFARGQNHKRKLEA